MKNILVLGGTRFFGLKAVRLMIENGYQVTIATRGKQPHPFGDEVNHLILDARDGAHEGWEAVLKEKWDAVFNNVLFTKEDAQLMIDKFSGEIENFYFTSSMAVYSGDKDGYVEEDFNPVAYEIDESIEVTYGEGKRQAETVLYKHAPFTVTAFRFPIVLDTDDYTERLHFYIEKALNQEKIYVKNLSSKVNYVKGSTAADSILWAIENDKMGMYNVSSIDAVTIQTLMDWIAEGTGQKINVVEQEQFDESSPLSPAHDQYLISDKIHEEGFELMELETWMKPLIKALNNEIIDQ